MPCAQGGRRLVFGPGAIPVDPFAVDIMACCFEDHLAAATERMADVFLVDQTTEEQIAFIDRPGLLLRIDR